MRGVTCGYGDRVILSNIDIDLPRGKVIGVMGTSGGGKTTLFRILTTLLVPDAGTATVLGHDVVRDAAV